MKRISLFALCFIFGSPLYAADLGVGAFPPVYTEPVEAPVELGTGWYLRGAIGRALDGTVDFDVPGIGRTPVQVRNDVIGEVAAGYQFNNWLRGDLSLEGSRAKGPDLTILRIDGNRVGVFANMFLDLGTWGNVSPFVGAGIGYAKTTVEATTALGAIAGLPITSVSVAHIAPAWALMAGLAYNIDRHAAITAEYRFVNYGRYSGSYSFIPLSVTSEPFKEQQLRVGIRYLID